MNTRLISVILAISVGVIMVGSVLVPTIIDANDDTKVHYNNNYGAFADVEKEDNVLITMGAVLGDSSGGSMTVNGDEVAFGGGGRSLLLSDNLSIVHNFTNGLAFSGISESGLINKKFTELTLTIANGEISATGTTDGGETESYSFDYDWCYYRANTGDYRLVDFLNTTRTVYLNNIDQIKSSGYIPTTGEFFSFSGLDVTIVDSDLNSELIKATATVNEVMDNVSSIVISSDPTNSSAFKFSVDNEGEPYDVLPSYFVVPYEVIGQTDTNIAIATILFAIPVIVLLSFVVFIVRTFSRND